MPDLLDQLALTLWEKGNEVEATELPKLERALPLALECGLISQNGSKILVADDRQLIARAARYFAQTRLLTLKKEPGRLFELLQEAQVQAIRKGQLAQAQQFGGKALADLHNRGNADILVLASEALLGTNNSYTVLTSLRSAIPYLNSIDSASLWGFVNPPGLDLAPNYSGAIGIIYDAIAGWLSSHPDIAESIVSRHLAHPGDVTASLFICALQAVAQNDLAAGVDRLIELCGVSDMPVSGPAMRTLGIITWPEEQSQAFERAIDFVKEVATDPTSALFPQAASTLTAMVATRPDFHHLLNAVAKTGTSAALHAIASYLARSACQFKDEQWYQDLVFECCAIPINQSRAFDDLDTVLGEWAINVNKHVQLLKWLNDWVGHQKQDDVLEWSPNKGLSDTFAKLIGQPSLVSTLVTDWLRRPEYRYPLMVERLLQTIELNERFVVVFDKSQVDAMDEQDIILLVRRALGYVFRENLCRSLFWSLTNTVSAETRTYNVVASLMVEQVGYDYPRDTKVFINDLRDAADTSTSAKALCTHILKSLTAYSTALDSLPRLKELQTSHYKSSLFGRSRWKQQQKVHDEMRKNSIVEKIATRIPLKGGRSSFSLRNGQFSDKMLLHTHSHSIAIARSVVTNEIGSEFERRMFRVSQRGTQ